MKLYRHYLRPAPKKIEKYSSDICVIPQIKLAVVCTLTDGGSAWMARWASPSSAAPAPTNQNTGNHLNFEKICSKVQHKAHKIDSLFPATSRKHQLPTEWTHIKATENLKNGLQTNMPYFLSDASALSYLKPPGWGWLHILKIMKMLCWLRSANNLQASKVFQVGKKISSINWWVAQR